MNNKTAKSIILKIIILIILTYTLGHLTVKYLEYNLNKNASKDDIIVWANTKKRANVELKDVNFFERGDRYGEILDQERSKVNNLKK